MTTGVTERISEQLIGRRVWGEPIEQDGVTVIPAASVRGGGGGGEGEQPSDGVADAKTAATGSGSGFGLAARPVGALVIRDGKVSWQSALNANQVVIGGQVVVVVALLVLRTLIKQRGRVRTAEAKN